MRYLLDTNICIYLMKNNSAIVERYTANKDFGIAISSITAAELFYGVYNSEFPEKNGKNLANFLVGINILDFDSYAAAEYGRIHAFLRKSGMLIGQMDMLIAAHAKSKNIIAVTNNIREFERIDGLKLENWMELI